MLLAVASHAVMIVGGVAIVLYLFVQWSLRRAARQMLDDFTKRYPGECPICSFHQYGIQQGHLRPDEPVGKHPHCANAPPQKCPECESPCFFTAEGQWIGCNCPEAQMLPYGGVE